MPPTMPPKKAGLPMDLTARQGIKKPRSHSEVRGFLNFTALAWTNSWRKRCPHRKCLLASTRIYNYLEKQIDKKN